MKSTYSAISCAVVLALLLPACTPRPPTYLPEPLKAKKPDSVPTASHPVDMDSERPALTVEPTPVPPVLPLPPRGEANRGSSTAKKEPANITLTFDQERLPTLIELVYGTILKRNFTMDPAVASRTDLVTLRAGPQTATQVEQTVRLLLKSYGVAVVELGGGTYRIVPDSSLQGYAPEIRRGRAMPDVPLPLRPIFQLVELQTVRNADVAGWLRSMFGTKLTIQEDMTRNAVMLSGQADDVMAGIEAVRILDQPGMKGRQSARINPVYINSELLASKLSEVMNSEGYSAGTTTQISYPVTFIPIQAINAVIAFAADPSILNHALEWARELDHPSAYRSEPGFFTYQAQNTDAQRLADTLREMLNISQAGTSSGAGTTTAPTSATPSSPGAPGVPGGTMAGQSSLASTANGAGASATGRRIVVNPSTNTLIFKGTNEEYSQVFSLLQDLDRPAKAALIEVTVAEVDLKDSMELGVELTSDMLTAGALTALTGGAGLTVQYLKPGSTKAINMIKALASQNRAQILSSPRLLARNGETAMIQVGQQVPIVTSQLGSAASSSIFPSNSNLLTSVQYKDVGVILKVKPVIYSGDRIELEVAQEVSDATSTSTGVTTSPTINTKKVETRLALKDGSTVMLGGLISNKESSGNSGVPLLKDLPILGQLFKTDTQNGERQELIILITPYTVLDDHDAQSITEAFRKQLGPWASSTRPTIPPLRQ